MFGLEWIASLIGWICESASLASERGRVESQVTTIAQQEAEIRALRRQVESLEATVTIQKEQIKIQAAVIAREHARVKAEISEFAARAENPPSRLP